jgi:gliding motility-associated lipoprotein GldH
LEYDFLIENPDITYDVSLGFTHLNAYYTDHLTANITFFMPDGSMRSRDYTFKLKNAQLEWLGINEKGIINHQLSVIEGIKFPEKGNYKIRVESKMPKFNLEHIKTVELIISPSK